MSPPSVFTKLTCICSGGTLYLHLGPFSTAGFLLGKRVFHFQSPAQELIFELTLLHYNSLATSSQDLCRLLWNAMARCFQCHCTLANTHTGKQVLFLENTRSEVKNTNTQVVTLMAQAMHITHLDFSKVQYSGITRGRAIPYFQIKCSGEHPNFIFMLAQASHRRLNVNMQRPFLLFCSEQAKQRSYGSNHLKDILNKIDNFGALHVRPQHGLYTRTETSHAHVPLLLAAMGVV